MRHLIVSDFMVHLLDAYQAAHGLQRDVWDFAVEIGILRQLGATNLALRRLVCQGFAEHAEEVVSRSRTQKRSFRKIALLSFSQKTCFVMTSEGAARPTKSGEAPFRTGAAIQLVEQESAARSYPRWASKDRALWGHGLMIKHYQQPAGSQEAILNAEKEQNWKQGIDDPLPGNGVDPVERLLNTLKNLNRYQHNQLLRFFGDGTGQHIFWKWLRL